MASYINLHRWGLISTHESIIDQPEFADFSLGRVISEHKDRYIVKIEEGEVEAEITGNLRFSAQNRSDFPVVGDWVALMVFDDLGIIHNVLPRTSLISRNTVGKKAEKQPIASNVDLAFVVMSLTEDFNLNRLDRYLTILHESGIKPIVLLSKMDLISSEEQKEKVALASKRASTTAIAIDNLNETGFKELRELIVPGKTYCVLGSSGVGKTTLINHLTDREAETKSISESTRKGMHTTTSRELVQLKNGGLLIDTPGMREIGIGTAKEGLSVTFSDVYAHSKNCKFLDCSHLDEPGCAVLEAVESGVLDLDVFENYQKLEKESAHFQTTIVEKRKQDRARGKMYKEVISFKKNSKR